MEKDTQEIAEISFGIYSSKEILSMAVCKIFKPKKVGLNTVYDERMGTTESTKLCPTCNLSAHECPGHFGYIELNVPVVHPMYYKRVVKLLNCFCLKCSRLLLTKEQIMLHGFHRYKGESRFIKIRERLKKVSICCHKECGCNNPRCKFSPSDSTIFKVYEGKDKTRTSIILTTKEIFKIFDNICDEDVRLLGFNPDLVHPRNFIINVLPVLPPADRPYVQADGNMCDDDITNNYVEIIKANNHLDPTMQKNKKDLNETKRQKFIASLKFRILTTFNNSQGKAKHSTNGRAIKGIKERLAGKDGQLRNNMMGKRSVKFGTMIWEWNGNMKRAEEVVVGDVVIGDDGLPRTVVDTVRGTSVLYKIKQSNGEDYSVSCEHLLTLQYCGHAKIHWRKNQSKYGGYSMKWFDRETKSIKSVKISVDLPVSKEEAKLLLEEFMKEKNISDKKKTWNPKRKKAGTWRVNWSSNGSKKSKEIAVNPGKTKEQALKEIESLRDSINTDPIIDIHIKDYLKLSLTSRRLMLGIKLSTPIQWPKKEVDLDPRILGMWLGDGGYDRSVFTNPDPELIEYFKDWTEKQGGVFNTYPDGLHHGISKCGFFDILRDNNLYENKHIPEEYIVNDVKTRLELLAGLIDTDGSVEQDGVTVRLVQCIKHKAIIDGAERIANSLGFRTSRKKRKTSWSNSKGKQKGFAIVLNISGNISIIPTLLPRKKCRDSKKDLSVTKISVVEDGIGRFCGFEVDGNHRFILGTDCTITHNCNQTARTVIGPDPTLKLGELAVPPAMASILTVPVRVTGFNLDILQTLVNTKKVNSLLKPDGKTRINLKRYFRGTRLVSGDIIYRGDKKLKVLTGRELLQRGDRVKRGDEFLERLTPSNREYQLKLNWIVERQLQDGDYVLLNRQPTLHCGSMMAMKVLIREGKTLRMNLSITPSFNADFDFEC